MNETERNILERVNAIRRRRWLRPLKLHRVLARAARAYSQTMAEREFFSHHGPDADIESPIKRARAAGGDFDRLGENIAMHPSTMSSAAEFVNGWMNSTGHRDNILDPDWEVSGVGVFTTDTAQVFATQLFGIRTPISVDDVKLTSSPALWYVLRVRLHIGHGYSLAAFVRNQFAASADADARGRVELECEIPASPGKHHVSFGRRRADSEAGWIGVYEGTAEIRADGQPVWYPASLSDDSLIVYEEALDRVSGSDLNVVIRGRARNAGIVVVDGVRTADLPAERFERKVSFRGRSGAHTIDIGLPEGETQYRVVRRFRIDADRGEWREE